MGLMAGEVLKRDFPLVSPPAQRDLERAARLELALVAWRASIVPDAPAIWNPIGHRLTPSGVSDARRSHLARVHTRNLGSGYPPANPLTLPRLTAYRNNENDPRRQPRVVR